MSNCLKFLAHPANGQTVNFSSNNFLGLYRGIRDLVYPSGNYRMVLKPFSNLYVLESAQTGFSNIEPVQVNFINNSGLPNGLALYKYNAITGKINNTGSWNIAARYVYNTGAGNLYESPVKYYTLNIFPPNTLLDNPLFDTVLDGNGNQLLPINSGGQILIPITGSGGQVGLIPSGFLSSGSGCITGLTSGTGFASGFIFCNSDECSSGQNCPYVDSQGETQEGGVQEPSKGGQKGDPVNVLPLRIVPNDYLEYESPASPIIRGIGSGCNFYTTMYTDTRDRTENLFIGRIGNRYVRVDTQTWSQGSAMGILRGINITKGFINNISNNVITSYKETEGTMYYVSSFGEVSGIGENPAQVYRFGNLFELNKGSNQPIPLLGPGFQIWTFFVEKNIGIGDVTALGLSWYYGNPRRTENSTELGGEINITLGELFRFDQIGGSLVENMQYIYNNVDLNYKNASNLETIDISNLAPWQDWGRELKFIDINEKFKHFYALDWVFTTAKTPGNWPRIDSNVASPGSYPTIPVQLSPSYDSSGNCVVTARCPSCDPACPDFSGHSVSNPNQVELCARNGQFIPRWLCACYDEFSLDLGPSTTSSLNPALFEELVN